jgi:C4-dicarboxylate-specific signal transduction histidine kinase
MSHRKSLTARIAGAYLVLSLLTVALICAAFYYPARRDMLTLSMGTLEAALAGKAENLDFWIGDIKRNMVFLARSLIFRGGGGPEGALPPPGAMSAYFRSVTEVRPEFNGIFFMAAPGGRVIASSNPGETGKFRTTYNYYTEGLRGTFLQTVYPSPDTLKPVITISTPVMTEKGALLGALAGHLNLERIDRIMRGSSGLGRTGEIYLVDRFGTLIRADSSGAQRNISSEGVVECLKGKSGGGMYLNHRGVPVIGIYRWLPQYQLALIAEMEQREALAPAVTLAWIIAGIGVAASCLLSAAALILSRRIARPILAVADTAREIALSGDLSRRAPALSDDEIGSLAGGFNRMIGQLADAQNSLILMNARLREEIASREKSERERREIETQLFSQAKLATLGEIATGVAHEINQPLTYISFFVQNLRLDIQNNELDTAKLDEMASNCMHSVHRISGIIQHLRVFGRSSIAAKESFSFESVFENTLLLMGEKLRLRNIAMTKKFSPGLPGFYGNPNQIEQIFLNLLQNSMDALEDRHENARISVEVSHDSSDNVFKIVFSDNGRGIPPAVIDRVFEPFFTTKPVGKGTGLGLSIIYGIVREHGGDIRVFSAPGGGAEFVIRFFAPKSPAPLDIEENTQILL